MMKTKSPIVLLVLKLTIVNFALGQNWSFINSKDLKYFAASPLLGKCYSIKIDSTSDFGVDSIFYNMQVRIDSTVSQLECGWGGHCEAFLVPGWLGVYIIKHANSKYSFVNSLDDTLKFDFDMSLHDTTTIYENDSIVLKMSYTSKDRDFVLSYLDSIKEYELIHYNKIGSKPLPLNKGKIKLGKDLGAISFFDVYNFPNKSTLVQLYGMKNPNLGLYEIRKEDIHNFEINDLFEQSVHEWKKSSFDGYLVVQKYIHKYKIIGKTVDDRDIRYKIFSRKKGIDYSIIGGDSIVDSLYDFHQTTEIIVSKDREVISIPFDNPFYKKYSARRDIVSIDKIDSCGDWRVFLTLDNTVNPTLPAYCEEYKCFGLSDCGGPDHPCDYGKNEYAMGLGELKEISGYPMHIGKESYSNNKMLFFKNKNGYCGIETLGPLDVNNILSQTPPISVAPNPFNSTTTLWFGNQKIAKIKILDLHGRVLKTFVNIKEKSFVISSDGLDQGFYLINVIGENRSSSQFVKIQVIK